MMTMSADPTNPRNRITVLVVDDEAPARQRLIDLLHKDEAVVEIIEAPDGAAAVEILKRHRPDAVFLDIQMPELDGFGVLRAIGPQNMPPTVFVTAFNQHAVQAFEANALDYLLKPFGDDRFFATMERLKAKLDDFDMRLFGERVLQALVVSGSPASHWDRLAVKSGGVTRFVRAVDIDWIEAAGVYVTLHVGGKEILYRAALHELAARLDPARFVRVHRSAIVNIDSILQLEPVSHGEFDVVLKTGARFRVSRSYRELLEKRLGQTL